MKKEFKRIVAMLMTVLMTFNSIPVTTLGEEIGSLIEQSQNVEFVEEEDLGFTSDTEIVIESESEAEPEAPAATEAQPAEEAEEEAPASEAEEESIEINSEEPATEAPAEETEASGESEVLIIEEVTEVEENGEAETVPVETAPATELDAGSDPFDAINTWAHHHYDVNDPQFIPGSEKISLSVTEKAIEGEPTQPPYKAGQYIKYNIEYTFKEIDLWYENYSQGMTTFDVYTNNVITVKLPEGLILEQAPSSYKFDVVENDDGSHDYIFKLKDFKANTSPNFDILVYICGNGTAESVRNFKLEDAVSFSTQFTVLDKYDVNNKRVVPFSEEQEYYQQTVKASLEDIQTKTDDAWKIKKSAVNKTVVPDYDKKEIVVQYDIEVGFEKDGKMEASPEYYTQAGRNAITEIKFSDVLSSEIHSTLVSGAAKLKGTPKIARYNGSGYDAAQDLDETKPVELTGALALNIVSVKSGYHYEEAETGTVPEGSDSTVTSGNDVQLITETTDIGAYTKYRVIATYELDEKLIEHFTGTEATIDFKNTSTLTYKLAGDENPTTDGPVDATAQASIKRNQPAHLVINKYLWKYNGTQFGKYDPAKSYSLGKAYGEISYTISSVAPEGGTAPEFKLYEKVGETYKPIGDPGTSFTVSSDKAYYLDAGIAYKVEENLTEEQQSYMTLHESECKNLAKTPAENENWTANVANIETLGTLTVTKKDDSNQLMGNVEFTLEYPDEKTVKKQTTGTSGSAKGITVFEPLPYGTYTLTETLPTGYSAEKTSYQIEINANNRFATQEITNYRAYATATLTKHVGIAQARTAQDMPKGNANFEGEFELQRKLATEADSKFVTVTEDYKGASIATGINGNGQIVAELPAYDNSKTAYVYRFKETVPEGYYDEKNPGTVIYSDNFVLYEDGKVKNASVDMFNRKKVTVKVKKEFYDVTDGTNPSLTLVKDRPVKVTLYTYDGNSMKPISTKEAKGEDATAAVWTDLLLFDSNGNKISYYVAEADVAGYQMDAQTSGTEKKVIGNTTYCSVDISANITADTFVNTFKNVQQVIPVHIYKKNYYTKAYVSGSGVTVYEGEGTTAIAMDAKDNRELDKIAVDNAYTTVYLAPGKTYNVKETVNGTGLKFVKVEPATIDLSNAAPSCGSGVALQTVTVYNKPDVTVTVKKVNASNTAADDLKTAEFTIYTKKADGSFEEYKKDGIPVIIKGDNENAIELPVGEYYALETKVPAGYIDLNKSEDTQSLYSSKYPDEYVTEIVDGKKKLLAKMKVEDKTGVTDDTTFKNTQLFTYHNIKNTGSVKVIKKLDGSKTSVSGFTAKLSGNGKTYTKAFSSGVATFSNIPVFDDAGNKIEYTITEDDSFDKNQYYKTFEGQKVTLIPGGTAGSDDGSLHIDNASYRTIKASKAYRNTWEYWYTQMDYPMGGVTVGLFEHDVVNGKWVKVRDDAGNYREVTTDATYENISFDKIRNDREYAIVELSCSDSTFYPYTVNGGEKEYAGTRTEISDADFSKYNTLKINAEGQTHTPINYLGTMLNWNHWVQFEETKWVDKDNYKEKGHGTAVNKDEDTKGDGAIYKLYRREMDAPGPVNFNTEDPLSNDWTLMGTYASGTAYGIAASGELGRLPGVFMTNVDQEANPNVVYLLVEVSAGPTAGIINPNFKYTFYQNENGIYSVNLLPESAAEEYKVRNGLYSIGAKTKDDLLNSKTEDPGGTVMVSSIRLAKWKDSFDEQTGELKQEYEPLGNVQFSIYLDASAMPNGTEEKLLETITTGLEKNEGTDESKKAATAQGAYYTLETVGEGTEKKWYLHNYEEEDSTKAKIEINEPEILVSDNTYTVYGVPVNIKEVSAPEGYTYNLTNGSIYMCFVESENSADNVTYIFNDSYFVDWAVDTADRTAVLADQQTGRTFYAYGDPAQASSIKGTLFTGGNPKYRIVDYPQINPFVTIKKYGYTPVVSENPVASTLGKTSDELDLMTAGDINRVAMNNVTFTLYKLKDGKTISNNNGDWSLYNYTACEVTTNSSEAQFTTGADGSFRMPKGLPEGTYRLIESNLPDKWKAYDKAYGDASSARIFKVESTDKIVSVSMYDAKLPTISITKKDLDGNVVSGIKFTLEYKDGSTTKTVKSTPEATGTDGKATFANLPSRVYTLKEARNGSGYSDTYLAKYIASLPDSEQKTVLTALTSSAGTKIGYTYEAQTADGGRDEKITAVGLNNVNFTLEVEDPSLGTWSIKKVNLEDENTAIAGAQFHIWYKNFDNFTGSDIDFPLLDNTWKDMGLSGASAASTGLISGTSQEPGIYAFVEEVVPAGYDKLKDTSDNDIVYYTVVKGGMNITFKESSLPELARVPGGMTVPTYFADSNAIVVRNRPMVTASATKVINKNELEDVVTGLQWKVTLTIYDSEKTSLGTAVITQANTGAVTFKNGSNAVKLSKGKDYYIKETINDSSSTNKNKADYAIEKLIINNREVTPENGYYKFTVENDDNAISVQATNTYLRGLAEFIKVDYDHPETRLSGAEFAIYEVTVDAEGKEVETQVTDRNAKVTEKLDSENKGTGLYVADIPLTGTGSQKFRIRETKAPQDFLLDTESYVEVVLSAKDNYKPYEETTGLVFKNSKGFRLVITKHNNIHAADPAAGTAAEGDAAFILYHEVEGEWKQAEPQKVIDGNGQVTGWLLDKNQKYAFTESHYNEIKYVALDGVYDEEDKEILATDGYYVIGYPTKDLSYDVYNVPKIKAKIVKKDAGGYPENVIPIVEFSIYELKKTEAEFIRDYEAGLITDQPVLNATTGNAGGGSEGLDYTDYTWKDRDPAKQYIVIETKTAAESGTYNTLNKDDKRVKWYRVIDTVTNPDPSVVEEFLLENVYGDFEATVSKSVVNNEEAEDVYAAAKPESENSVVNGEVESLLKGDRYVEYTITPGITKSHNQALKSFVIEDTGLTFQDESSSDYMKDTTDYELTYVTVGKASQDVTNFIQTIEDAKVSADIEYTLKSGDTGVITITDVADENQRTQKLPSGTQKIAIKYYSAAVSTATDGAYTLGSDFKFDETSGAITVKATVFHQEDGTVTDPVKQITKIRNTAKLDYVYPQWNESGKERTDVHPDPTVVQADISVKKVALPTIAVKKSSNAEEDGKAPHAEPGDEIEYYITITNTSETEDFIDPVIIDTLPAGVTFESCTVGAGTQGETFENPTVYRYTGETTLVVAGKPVGDAETAVSVALDGALKPNSSVVVTIKAVVHNSARLYGDKIYNFVYLSSNATSYHTFDNNHGYAFADNDKNTLDKASEVYGGKEGVATVREKALEKALGEYADAESAKYIWVGDDYEIILLDLSALVTTKAVRGDQDGGNFNDSDDFLGTATRTNEKKGTDGSVDFRLTIENGDPSAKYGVSVGDAIPKGDALEGKKDENGSIWGTNFKEISSVQFAGDDLDADAYTVFYYTGPAIPTAQGSGDGSLSAVEAVLEDTNGWVDDAEVTAEKGAWPQRVEKGYKLPENWYISGDDEVKDLTKVTAFIIVFNREYILEEGKRIIITYSTTTEDMTEEDIWNASSFENVYNKFETAWRKNKNFIESKRVASNTVKAVLMDDYVKVEGDLWIDEDWSGTQKDNGSSSYGRTNYEDYAIITALKDSLKVVLTDERKSSGAPIDPSYSYPETDDVTEGTKSVKRYTFEQLGAGYPRQAEIYTTDSEGNLILDPVALKSSDPYYYTMTASISKDLASIFKLTTRGSGHYMTDDPDQVLKDATATANAMDSNFKATTEGGTSYYAYPFYIPYSTNVDESKDIGFIMERALSIEKVAADDGATPVEGAEFQIYGPFNEGTAAPGGTAMTFSLNADGKYVPDADGEATLVTSAAGKIDVDGLNWWKEYVITETKAAPGYKLEGAIGTAAAGGYTVIEPLKKADGTVIPGSWVLRIPGKQKVNKTDNFMVTNRREVTATPEAEKIVTAVTGSYTIEAGDFTFGLYSKDTCTEDDLIETKVNDENGNVEFSEITYDRPGDYTYYIKEIIPAQKKAFLEYSEEVITVNVNVVWSATEKALVATVSYAGGSGDEKNIITNKYKPEPAKATFPVKKNATGQTRPEADPYTFKFTLAGVEDEEGTMPPMPARGGDVRTIELPYNKATDTAIFGEITFDKVGTYTYEITEEDGQLDCWKYDGTVYTAVVTVTDNGTGKLASSVKYFVEDEEVPVPKEDGKFYGPEFTNEYNPVPVKAQLPAAKKVTGKNRKVDTDITFEFVLEGVEKDGKKPPMPATKDKFTLTYEYNEFDQKSDVFGEIEYTSAGVYTYTVRENMTSKVDGWTFDTNLYTAIVTVTDKGGELSQSVEFTKGGAAIEKTQENPDGIPLFVNDYDPGTTSQTFPVKKTVTGQVRPQPKEGEPETYKFTFTIEAEDIPMPEEEEVVLEFKYNDFEQQGQFGPVKYDMAGTYTYTVEETAEASDGWTYSQLVYEVTVTVVDDGGILSSSVEYSYLDTQGAKVVVPDPEDITKFYGMEFINDYTPEPTEIQLPVKKTAIGQTRPEEPEFYDFLFTLTGVEDEDGKMPPMPAEGGEEVTISLPYDEESRTEEFSVIEYKEAGTYTYTVEEESGTEDCWQYDGTVYTAVVTVTDNDGHLSAEAKYYVDGKEVPAPTEEDAFYGPEFKNEYIPVPTEAKIPVKKTVTGLVRPYTEKDKFTFTLTAKNGAPMPAEGEDVVELVFDPDAIDVFDIGEFGWMKYTEAGDYEYTVKETVTSPIKGWQYDETEWTVIVHVVDNKGTLEATVLVDRAEVVTDREKYYGPEFTNKYYPEPVDVILPVKKTVDGQVRFKSEVPYTFTFTLAGVPDEQGNQPPVPAAGEEVEELKFSYDELLSKTGEFGKIEYTDPGVYTYTVQETVGTDTGWVYDGTIYTVKVTVTDAGGEYAVDVKYFIGEEPAELPAFTNTYNPVPTDQVFGAKKTIIGNERPEDQKQTFEFELKAIDGAPLPDDGVTVISTVDEGEVFFDKITYTKAGTYEYDLSEIKKTIEGYEFDGTVYHYVVTVTDEQGILKAVTKIAGKEVPENMSEFTNKYNPNPDEVIIDVRKIVDGTSRPAGYVKVFKFDLAAVTPGAPLPKDGVLHLEITDEGVKAFDAIKFEKAGVYEYTVKEQFETSRGYTYDEVVREVKVAVTDDHGKLIAKCRINDIETSTAEFTNKFDGIGQLEIMKRVSGTYTSKKFPITLKFTDKNGNPITGSMPATFTDSDGNSSPITLTFDATGLAKFELGHYEKIFIDDLLGGTRYEVTETDAKGYTVSYEGAIGVIVGDEVKHALVKNYKQPGGHEDPPGTTPHTTVPVTTPPETTPDDGSSVLGAGGSRVRTGDTSNVKLYLALFLVSGGLLAGLALTKKKREDEEAEETEEKEEEK